MVHNYQQKYENVLIKQISEDDLEHLRVWRNDSQNTKYLRRIPYITSDMQRSWFQSYLVNKDEMIFVIEETEVINGVVGSMSLYNFVDGVAEFGKFLIGEPNAHGKSVGVNALEALKAVARDKLNLIKLYLHVYSDNEVAIKVYKDAGFDITNRRVTKSGLDEYTMEVQL